MNWESNIEIGIWRKEGSHDVSRASLVRASSSEGRDTKSNKTQKLAKLKNSLDFGQRGRDMYGERKRERERERERKREREERKRERESTYPVDALTSRTCRSVRCPYSRCARCARAPKKLKLLNLDFSKVFKFTEHPKVFKVFKKKNSLASSLIILILDRARA